MKCIYCNDSGKYKQSKNQELFEKLVDIEMEKGYFVSYEMAEERIHKKVGFEIVECPYCSANKNA